MVDNFATIRRSTLSEDLLKVHLVGPMGLLGFEDNVMRYGWPGTVTQTIDNSWYGQPMAA
jgi:hypothetical protein